MRPGRDAARQTPYAACPVAGIRHPRVACDSLVALGNSTADGSVLFAKNSDRPAHECQPLVQLPALDHPAGSPLRCQYVEIPQVVHTARLIGSRPFWLWGFEHGVNEHGVAIGNHTVFTRDPLPSIGLTGMDLVRLGLERATDAEAAVAVITGLVEEHGQGGSGYFDKDWPYHNSFLIADTRRALLLETSARNWALREIADVGSASNHLSIGSSWTALSPQAVAHACAQGWWEGDARGRFDFAAAYRDTELAPEVISSGRYRRSCELLAEHRGRITPSILREALRDHYGRVSHACGDTPADETYFALCMHADPVGTTTASIVARLPAGSDDIVRCWAALGSPCASTFLPCYLDGQLPAVLGRGGEKPSDDSPWWMFHRLRSIVETDPDRLAPQVRAHWAEFETRALDRAEATEAEALDRRRRGDRDGAAQALTRVMHELVDAALESARGLVQRLS